jgi:hypothetical protein
MDFLPIKVLKTLVSDARVMGHGSTIAQVEGQLFEQIQGSQRRGGLC